MILLLAKSSCNADRHLVPAVEVSGETHVALPAVEKVLPPADPADAAAVAMELRLVLIVKQFAFVAEVL